MSSVITPTAQKIQQYLVLRDHKKAADEEFKKSMERVNAAMEKLEAEILAELHKQGLDSFAAHGIGTAYIRNVTSMTTENRQEFLAWAIHNQELDAMDIRPNKTVVNELLQKGTAVPGVKVSTTQLIGVRKDS